MVIKSWFIFLALMMSTLDTSEGELESDGIYTLELYLLCDQLCDKEISRWETEGTEQYLIEVVRTASKTLSKINLDLILVGMEIWSHEDRIPTPPNMEEAVQHLGKFRAEHQIPKLWSDATLLVTGHDWETAGTESRGLFNRGGICLSMEATGTIVYNMQSAGKLAATMSHELGHGLGMAHDTAGCCAIGNGHCVMAPVMHSQQTQIINPTFSSCSRESLKEFLKTRRSACLHNKAEKAYPPNTCGNGIVEEEEECDCGAACLNNCCNCCRSCKLVPGGECAQGACCDTTTCKFYQSGHVCRESRHLTCDKQDVCSGDSAQCEDKQSSAGEECTDHIGEAGYCLAGRCQTQNVQCQETWKQGYVNADEECYAIAKNYPTERGHCGVTPSGAYKRCSSKSESYYKCGLLQCSGDGQGLSQYMKPKRNYYVGGGHYCWSGIHGDWDEQRFAPIMVKNGTKCGPGKVCYNKDCIEADSAFQLLLDSNNDERQPLCGDGVVEGNEECDCGAKQCDCCDRETCKLREENSNCLYTQCGMCDGKTPECVRLKAPEFTSCDEGDGHCVNGECHSLSRTCKRLFGESATVPRSRYRTNNYTSSSQFANAGGFLLYNLNTFRWSPKKEFASASGNGQCGLLFCKSVTSAVLKDDRGNTITSRTFFLTDDRSIRVIYYSIEKVRLGPTEAYQRWYPVLTDYGTPCQTNHGEPGYCETRNLIMDKRDENWYWKAMCVPLP